MADSWLGVIAPVSVGGIIAIIGIIMVLSAKYIKKQNQRKKMVKNNEKA
jgi:hypothetical protein